MPGKVNWSRWMMSALLACAFNMSEEKEQEKKYGLDIRRHSAHSRSFPWMAFIKILIGIGIAWFTWYIAKTMFEKAALNKEEPPKTEIELEF
jgi:hypothetical protein